MSSQFEVVIVGGGIVGLSAAIAMVQRGFSVAVVDAGSLAPSAVSLDTRVYAINQASKQLLETLGVWPGIAASELAPYRQMHVWDAVGGSHIDFDARLIGAASLGYMMRDVVIKNALLDRARALEIQLMPLRKVCGVKSDSLGMSMTCNGAEETIHANLLIAADGALSAIREQLRVPLTTWSYHHHAMTATVQHELPHQQTAYQVFHADGPLAFLPLADPHQCSIVWSTTPARSSQLMALDEHEFHQALSQAFAFKLGEVRLLTQRHQFPLHMRHAQQYSGPGWFLMGDAAHTIHPLAGLGLNLGLADLTVWLELMDAAGGVYRSPKILRAYQRQRKYALWQVICVMEGLKMAFSNTLPPFVALRRKALSACQHLSPLKRFFINQAAGKEFF